MACDNEPGEVALRANTLLTDAATLAGELPVATHVDPDLPEALVLEGPFDAHDSPAWRAGAFLAQSRAAMLVSRVLDPRPGERVLDLCAAPGGKSTHLAALMGGEGEVVAVERNARRAGHARAHRAAAARRQRPRRGRRRRGEAPGGSGVRPRARRSAVLGAWARCRRAPTCAGG